MRLVASNFLNIKEFGTVKGCQLADALFFVLEGNFELTVLLTVVTTLHIRSSELILLISGSLYPLTCISHFYLLSSPGNQHVCFYEISFVLF